MEVLTTLSVIWWVFATLISLLAIVIFYDDTEPFVLKWNMVVAYVVLLPGSLTVTVVAIISWAAVCVITWAWDKLDIPILKE